MKKIFSGSSKILLTVLIFASTLSAADSTEAIVIDVRTTEEYSENHLRGSINIDVLNSNFREKVALLDKNKAYKVYCRSGNRSGGAEMIMRSLGFKKIENIGSLSQAAKKLNQTCQKGSC